MLCCFRINYLRFAVSLSDPVLVHPGVVVALAVAVDKVGGRLEGDRLLLSGHHGQAGQSCQENKGLHLL